MKKKNQLVDNGEGNMAWKCILATASICGCHRKIDQNSRGYSQVCNCGHQLTPVFFRYDFDTAFLGGIEYIIDQLSVLAEWEAPKGLDDFMDKRFVKREAYVKPKMEKTPEVEEFEDWELEEAVMDEIGLLEDWEIEELLYGKKGKFRHR